MKEGSTMTEIETIARAQMYLEKLANGVNPLTDTEVNENDVVNNVRISRCLFYVSGILKQIVDNKGKFKVEMPDRAEYTVTSEQIAKFMYSEQPISVSELTKRLNDLVNQMYIAASVWLEQSRARKAGLPVPEAAETPCAACPIDCGVKDPTDASCALGEATVEKIEAAVVEAVSAARVEEEAAAAQAVAAPDASKPEGSDA